MDSFAQDLRQSIRRLAQSPGFASLALMIVALGIGANAAIFTVVDGFLFRPMPWERPEELVHIYQDADDGVPSSSSYPAYLDMTAQTEVFTGVTAIMSGRTSSWMREAETVPVSIAVVTSSYFPVLGLRPHIGRAFEAAEDDRYGPPAAIVSYRTWQRQLGGDPGVLGGTVRLNGAPLTLVGVGPEGYGGIVPGHNVDFWASISSLEPTSGPFVGGTLERRADHWFDVMARLRAGVTPERAQAAMDLLAARLAREFPEYNEGRDITVFRATDVRIHPGDDADLYPIGAVLMAIVGLVLLVACSNLANLLLARASTRGREVAIRLAMGATRGRLVRYLMTESALLSVGGGVLGVIVAAWLTRLLTLHQPPLPIPVSLSLSVDVRAVAFSMGLAVLTGLAFGLVPALRASRPDLVPSLKDADEAVLRRRSGGTPRWLSFRSLLVVAQVAASLVLLIGAGLMVRSLRNVQDLDLGFDSRGLAILQANAGQAGYDAATADPVFRELSERVAALPGVEAMTATTRLPLTFGGSSTLVIDEYNDRAGTSSVEVEFSLVEPGYFETMGIPLLHGRAFDETDRGDGTEPIAVISEAMARRYYGTPDAVGKRYRHQGSPDSWRRIVGVVGDVKTESVSEPPTPMFYRPLQPGVVTALTVVARTSLDAADTVGAMRRELRAVDPDIPVYEAGTMEDHLAASLALPRAAAGTLGLFGAVALLLASIGLYAVVAFAVSQRTSEVGIRMALGAEGGQVVAMMVREMMALVALGVVLGVAMSMIAAPTLGSLLFGVPALDPLTFASVAALLALVALAATWLPARRAARTDPMLALRRSGR